MFLQKPTGKRYTSDTYRNINASRKSDTLENEKDITIPWLPVRSTLQIQLIKNDISIFTARKKIWKSNEV